MKNSYYLIFMFLIVFIPSESKEKVIEHFIYFGRDTERIHDSLFVNTKEISGAQLKYSWKQLEPVKNTYDFNDIENDLKFLTSINKKLFIQIQDVSFDTNYINVPNYIRKDPEYNGGVFLQYEYRNNNLELDGVVARRFDDNVAARFHKLIINLGKKFNGRIYGINLPETAIGIPQNKNLHPKGFTYEKYVNAIKSNMKILKESFPNSIAILYANFMPGEYKNRNDQIIYLKELYEYSSKIKLGMGGPDLLAYKDGQMRNSYPLIKEISNKVIIGIAAQWNNYKHVNPKTNKRQTVKEMYDFAKDYLNANIIFWSPQQPFYKRDVIPFIKKVSN